MVRLFLMDSDFQGQNYLEASLQHNGTIQGLFGLSTQCATISYENNQSNELIAPETKNGYKYKQPCI